MGEASVMQGPEHWVDGTSAGSRVDLMGFLHMVALGLPTGPSWASVSTSLQGEAWAG